MKKILVVLVISLLAGCSTMLWFPAVPVPVPAHIEEEVVVIVVEEEPPEEEPEIIEEIEEVEEIEEIPHIEEYEPVYVRKPMIALSFDDGPSQHTERILDLLEEHGGRATFFVLGYRIERYMETVERMLYLENELANHSWTHTNLTTLNEEAIIWEIMTTNAAIEAVAGYAPQIVRPPFGRTCARVRQVAEDLGFALTNWSLDPLDWRYRDPDRIYNVIMDEKKDGAVVVLHDIHATTAQAMERVIPRLVEEGFQLVTVSEVLEYLYGELVPGKVYGRVVEE